MVPRPQVIYLTEPIFMQGIRVGLTPEGLKFMIDHYQHLLTIATPQQMDDKVRQHITTQIENYTIHLELYQRQTTTP